MSRPRCQIHAFFERHRDLFLRIKTSIDALDDDKKSEQLRAFSKVIGEAASDPKILLDYKNGCVKLADVLIAVDSRDYGSMFSMNAAESTLLTKVLGQDFYYLPSNPENEAGGVQLAVWTPTSSPAPGTRLDAPPC